MTATGMRGGTPGFMPREQLTEFRYARCASDVWSLAATFYYMLTGHHPLDFAADRDPLEVILRDKPIPIRDRTAQIPTPLAEVIDRGLAIDLDRRYGSAAEMRHALRSVL